MTDADGAGLLAAIIADPGDDLPRLAYADWLDEQGQAERAEFIRVQLELHWNRTSGHPRRPKASAENDARQDWLEARERLLWRPPYKGLPHPMEGWLCTTGTFAPDGRQLQVRRGFVAAVRCTLAQWEIHGKELMRCHPLGRVELSDREPQDYRSSQVMGPVHGFISWKPALHEELVRFSLPLSLWHAVAEHPRAIRNEQWADFRERQDALDALSAACLRWARSPDA